MSHWRSTWSWLLLVMLPALLYAPFLVGGKVLYWGVYLLQFHPWHQLVVEQIQAGRWPLWNPYLGAGTPLAANLQTAAFYPPNALFLLMPVEQVFGWELALHVALAGLFAYYLGRKLGMSSFGSLVTGLTYGAGGYVVAHWVFPSMVYAIAWLPLMLALAEKLIRRATQNAQNPESRFRSGIGYWILDIALLALTIALQLLAGHAQTSFYSAMIVGAYSLYRIVRQQVGSGRQIWSSLGAGCSLVIAALWGVALAAIQLLPTAELVAHSQRAGTLTDLQFAFELSFWPWRLVTLLAPDFFGNPARNEYWANLTYWEEAAYVGILPLLLAVLSFFAWWRKRKDKDPGHPLTVPFWSVLAFVSLVLALGNHTPLYPLLFRYVPGFGLFQAPARLMIGFALGLALLAGIGADTYQSTPRTRTMLRFLLIIGFATAIGGAFARLILDTIRPSFGEAMVRLGLSLALAAAALLLRGPRLRGSRWQALIIAFIALDLLAFGWGLAPGTSPSLYRAPVASAEFLHSQAPGRIFVAYPHAQRLYDEYISLRSFGSTDPAHLQAMRENLLPNLNAALHLPSVDNYDPLTIGHYDDLWKHLEGSRAERPRLEEILPLLNLFGARYVISDTVASETPLPLIYDAGTRIYHNDSALPSAYVVAEARVIENPEERLELLLDPAFDPRANVVLSRKPRASLPLNDEVAVSNHPHPRPTVLRDGADRVIIEVNLAEPGFLVLTDTDYPGWEATIDGQPTPILQANHAFRAVGLGAGEHTVVFEYRPLSFRLGAWTTLAATLLLMAALAVGWWKKKA